MADPSPVLDASEPPDSYPISTVAKLTGLSVHTIRAWEKRYGVVAPLRTDSQRRLYSHEHLRKLSLLRALVECGQPISSIAHLSVSSLQARLESSSGEMSVSSLGPSRESCTCATPWRVGVAGPSLLSLFDTQAAHLPGLEVAVRWPSLTVALEQEPLDAALDLMTVEVDALFLENLGQIRRLADRTLARNVIVVYGFAQKDAAAQLRNLPHFTGLRGPVNAGELLLAARHPLLPPPPPGELPPIPAAAIPPRVYSPEQLARLARLAPQIQCECPQHLANLISSLAAFETYSAACENRDEADAALHAYLHRTTALARREMEQALSKVLEREGIRV